MNVLAPATRVSQLRAPRQWQPSRGDLVRGRAALVGEFERPDNLPVQEYAIRAGKTIGALYKDISSRRLLALSVARRGQRVPGWQLQSNAGRLTRSVLAAAHDVDNWTIYQALTGEMNTLGGKAPIHAVSVANLKRIAAAICDSLGVRPLSPHDSD
jgi:hypothetical protein